MDNEPTKGYKTTEFYTAVAGQVIALLVAFGVVKTSDADGLTTAITTAAVAIAALLASAAIVWKYIQSRTVLKTVAAIPPATVEVPPTIRSIGL